MAEPGQQQDVGGQGAHKAHGKQDIKNFRTHGRIGNQQHQHRTEGDEGEAERRIELYPHRGGEPEGREHAQRGLAGFQVAPDKCRLAPGPGSGNKLAPVKQQTVQGTVQFQQYLLDACQQFSPAGHRGDREMRRVPQAARAEIGRYHLEAGLCVLPPPLCLQLAEHRLELLQQ